MKPAENPGTIPSIFVYTFFFGLRWFFRPLCTANSQNACHPCVDEVSMTFKRGQHPSKSKLWGAPHIRRPRQWPQPCQLSSILVDSWVMDLKGYIIREACSCTANWVLPLARSTSCVVWRLRQWASALAIRKKIEVGKQNSLWDFPEVATSLLLLWLWGRLGVSRVWWSVVSCTEHLGPEALLLCPSSSPLSCLKSMLATSLWTSSREKPLHSENCAFMRLTCSCSESQCSSLGVCVSLCASSAEQHGCGGIFWSSRPPMQRPSGKQERCASGIVALSLLRWRSRQEQSRKPSVGDSLKCPADCSGADLDREQTPLSCSSSVAPVSHCEEMMCAGIQTTLRARRTGCWLVWESPTTWQLLFFSSYSLMCC